MLLAILLAAWPADSAALISPELPALPAKKIRVVVDAGHGAPGNVGNIGCRCQEERSHTLTVANFLSSALEATGRFEVKRGRLLLDGLRYQARIASAEAWKADVIISIHSDARGESEPIEQGDGGVCWQNPAEPGFSVLWNDEGEAFPAREKLGRAVGARMRAAGFPAYSGINYGDLYRQDPVEPSGWIDKRPKKQRVYFLRASKIPTIIIETHHARDLDEVARWDEAKTLETFSAVVAAAILDFTSKR